MTAKVMKSESMPAPRPSEEAVAKPSPSLGPRGGRERVTERVVLAAQELFARRGFAGVTVREIAEKAGVSHALVHRYFGSKHDILVAVFRYNATPMAALALGDVGAHEAALAMARALRTNRRDYVRLVTRLALDGTSVEFLGHDFPAFRLLVDLLQRETDSAAVQAGRSPDPRVVAVAATALIFGWTALEDWFPAFTGWHEDDMEGVERSLELVIGAMIDASLSPAAAPAVGTPAAPAVGTPSAPRSGA
jgi:AcrR family transcriptional regulator